MSADIKITIRAALTAIGVAAAFGVFTAIEMRDGSMYGFMTMACAMIFGLREVTK